MRIKLPRDVHRDARGSIALDGLVLAAMRMGQWIDLCDADHIIDLAQSSMRARLVAACRLLYHQGGVNFNANLYELLFEVDAPEGGRLLAESCGQYFGKDLLAAADLVHVNNSLVDGDHKRRRRRADETNVIAFYLPQFYPFAENDKWWGEGFTEWSNVVEAKPNLPGHHMPLLPADLGFYDLRIADTRRRQGQLADEYGVDGFCYYFYWFNGRRIMQEVLDTILASGTPENDFCLCWANESWSRRWDGSEGAVDLLIKQSHDPAQDALLIKDLIPYFMDPRYIKIDGMPVILIYRLDIMKDVEEVTAAWRAEVHKYGFPGLFVAAVRSFGLKDGEARCVDAVVDFPPHTAVSSEIQKSLPVNASFEGKIYDYRQVIINAAAQPAGEVMCFPGVMPRWDNTPRKGERSNLFWNSSPSAFKIWLALALEQSQQLPLGRRFLFINSWNEWGEGAMLEPDRVYGRAYLEALRSVRGGYVVAPSETADFALISSLPSSGAEAMLQGFAAEVQMVAQMVGWQRMRSHDAFRIGEPELLSLAHDRNVIDEGTLIIDHSSSKPEGERILLRYGQPLRVIGWTMTKRGAPRRYDALAYLCLTRDGSSAIDYHIPVAQWIRRADVVAYHGMSHGADESYFGFEVTAGTDNVSEGSYHCSMLEAVEGTLYQAICVTRLERGRR